jgi:uncharacterized surface protein with fasciclin (FAS1) repeats
MTHDLAAQKRAGQPGFKGLSRICHFGGIRLAQSQPGENLMFNRRILTLAVTAALASALAACATSPAPVSVADTLAATPQLSTLNGLVVKAGLTDMLKGTGPFTVFAPSNDAFAKVPVKTLSELAADPVKLKAVLAYHVVPGKLMAADIKNSNVKTANGATVALAKAGDYVTVEDALVQRADIAATNGVVHITDGVLMPPK